jgi:hypothetical protein
VSSAPGENAGLHGLLRGEEGEDTAQDFIREGTYAVAATLQRRLPLSHERFTVRHSGGHREDA